MDKYMFTFGSYQGQSSLMVRHGSALGLVCCWFTVILVRVQALINIFHPPNLSRSVSKVKLAIQTFLECQISVKIENDAKLGTNQGQSSEMVTHGMALGSVSCWSTVILVRSQAFINIFHPPNLSQSVSRVKLAIQTFLERQHCVKIENDTKLGTNYRVKVV